MSKMYSSVQEFIEDVLNCESIIYDCQSETGCSAEEIGVVLNASLSKIIELLKSLPCYYKREYVSHQMRGYNNVYYIHVNVESNGKSSFSLFKSIDVYADGGVGSHLDKLDVPGFMAWVLRKDLLGIMERLVSEIVSDQEAYKKQSAGMIGRFRGEGTRLPCSEAFEKKFHNTGKTLKVVVNELKSEGYVPSDIVNAMMKVLADITWDD